MQNKTIYLAPLYYYILRVRTKSKHFILVFTFKLGFIKEKLITSLELVLVPFRLATYPK